MQYLCLVYHDERQLGTLGQDECDALAGEALAYDRELRQSGHHIAAAALQVARTATILRVRGGAVGLTEGPYAETREQLRGFLLIEARDLNDAIRIAAKIPGARVGCVEVRPVQDPLAP